jgi:hypothetical protein
MDFLSDDNGIRYKLHRTLLQRRPYLGTKAWQAWDPTAYDAALTRLYATKTPAQLAQLARVRCRGGE